MWQRTSESLALPGSDPMRPLFPFPIYRRCIALINSPLAAPHTRLASARTRISCTLSPSLVSIAGHYQKRSVRGENRLSARLEIRLPIPKRYFWSDNWFLSTETGSPPSNFRPVSPRINYWELSAEVEDLILRIFNFDFSCGKAIRNWKLQLYNNEKFMLITIWTFHFNVFKIYQKNPL